MNEKKRYIVLSEYFYHNDFELTREEYNYYYYLYQMLHEFGHSICIGYNLFDFLGNSEDQILEETFCDKFACYFIDKFFGNDAFNRVKEVQLKMGSDSELSPLIDEDGYLSLIHFDVKKTNLFAFLESYGIIINNKDDLKYKNLENINYHDIYYYIKDTLKALDITIPVTVLKMVNSYILSKHPNIKPIRVITAFNAGEEALQIRINEKMIKVVDTLE